MYDPIEKRRVTMTSVAFAGNNDDGTAQYHEHQITDYVPVDVLDAYVTDARERWQHVSVGEEHDPGPGGDEGATHYPAHLDHPLAGQTFGDLTLVNGADQ